MCDENEVERDSNKIQRVRGSQRFGNLEYFVVMTTEGERNCFKGEIEIRWFYLNFSSAASFSCLMMAATHLPTTHTHTRHTLQTIIFRMRSHLLFFYKRRKMATKEKRKITLEWLMENRKGSDRQMCACIALSTVLHEGEIKRRQREWNQLFPFNYIWERLIEIPLQVFSVWVPRDNPDAL